MKIKLHQSKVDFMSTPIENLFLDTYLPLASGNQLKVYLFAYKSAYKNEEINNEKISKSLDISLEEVNQAWEFWVSLGLVKKHKLDGEDIYEFKSIRLLYTGLDKDYEEEIPSEPVSKEVSLVKEEVVNKNDNSHNFEINPDELSEMYKVIEDYISLDQPVHISLDPKDIRILNDLVYDYKLNPYFVSYAYHLASEVNDYKSKNPPYVSKVIERWVKYENVRSVEDLDTYIEKRSEEKQEKKEVKKASKPRAKNVYNDDRLSKAERRALIQKKLRESKN